MIEAIEMSAWSAPRPTACSTAQSWSKRTPSQCSGWWFLRPHFTQSRRVADSLAALDAWRDAPAQLGWSWWVRSCSLCVRRVLRAQIKSPLEEALRRLAAARRGCRNRRVVHGHQRCPFGKWLQSDMQPYWNNYIPAFIGVRCRLDTSTFPSRPPPSAPRTRSRRC